MFLPRRQQITSLRSLNPDGVSITTRLGRDPRSMEKCMDCITHVRRDDFHAFMAVPVAVTTVIVRCRCQ